MHDFNAPHRRPGDPGRPVVSDVGRRAEDDPIMLAAAGALFERWEDRDDPYRGSLRIVGEDPRTVAQVAVAAVVAALREDLATQIEALHPPGLAFTHLRRSDVMAVIRNREPRS